MTTANDMYSTSYLLQVATNGIFWKVFAIQDASRQQKCVSNFTGCLFFVPEDMNPILSWPLAITSHLQRREHPGIYLTTLLNIQNHTLSSKTFKNCRKNNQDFHDIILDSVCLSPISPQTYTKKTQRIRSLATASSLSTCGAHRIPIRKDPRLKTPTRLPIQIPFRRSRF